VRPSIYPGDDRPIVKIVARNQTSGEQGDRRNTWVFRHEAYSQLIGGIFMIRILRKAGVSSSMLYTAGIASIGLSIASWFTSRNLESKGIARADRWGIFVGQWAPTFFALGNAMRMEEEMGETRPSERVEEMKTRAREKMPMS
jgi:hypothetical protein